MPNVSGQKEYGYGNENSAQKPETVKFNEVVENSQFNTQSEISSELHMFEERRESEPSDMMETRTSFHQVEKLDEVIND